MLLTDVGAASIVNVKVAVAAGEGGEHALVLVNVNVTVAPLAKSFVPKVYVGVRVVPPAEIVPSPPLIDQE